MAEAGITMAKLSLILRVKQAQLEMLDARGYNIETESNILKYDSERPEHLKEFQSYYEDEREAEFSEAYLSHKYSKADEKNVVTIVYYIPSHADNKSGTVKKDELKEAMNYALNLIKIKIKIEALIIISENVVPKTAMGNYAKAITDENSFEIQIFNYTDLLINPTKYYNLPLDDVIADGKIPIILSYERLSPKDAKRILDDNNISIRQLPMIKYASINDLLDKNKAKANLDPIVKYYNYKPGDIIRITRILFYTNSINRTNIFYRHVSK